MMLGVERWAVMNLDDKVESGGDRVLRTTDLLLR